ncbi:MAG TPA: LysM peptidoglycan-binding domain-containing protein [Thermomicrobiaceae bacterium]|nr:LysM peptidoglycan-binding domain-containing protein [Thermomicrobiaceae bacterium]
MIGEQQEQGESGLVALYATRVRSRAEVSATRTIAGPAPEMRSFGRPAPVQRRRRFRARRAAGVSALVATGLIVGTQAAAAATTHQVQPGETLGGIAAHYHVSVQQLAQLNGIGNPNLIIAGSTLTIDQDQGQDQAPAAGQQAGAKEHQVLPGETLTTIASQYGVTVDAVAKLNNLANPNVIVVGSELKIPSVGSSATQSASPPPDSGQLALHLVVPGETLTTIARSYGVQVRALAEANGISDLDLIEAGQMLRIPASLETGPVVSDGTVKLDNMPVMQQSLPLSCEDAAVSLATAYWGHQVSEWVFIENMPHNANPHLGFRGRLAGAFGGTDDYGVYAEPFVSLLSRYGYTGQVIYAEGDAGQLKSQIDQGHPVVAWITNMASVQDKSYGTADGARFALVPQEHAVVVYGYDANGVFVADPGDGAYRHFNWGDFLRSWGYFDGMSLAVYPSA